MKEFRMRFCFQRNARLWVKMASIKKSFGNEIFDVNKELGGHNTEMNYNKIIKKQKTSNIKRYKGRKVI